MCACDYTRPHKHALLNSLTTHISTSYEEIKSSFHKTHPCQLLLQTSLTSDPPTVAAVCGVAQEHSDRKRHSSRTATSAGSRTNQHRGGASSACSTSSQSSSGARVTCWTRSNPTLFLGSPSLAFPYRKGLVTQPTPYPWPMLVN